MKNQIFSDFIDIFSIENCTGTIYIKFMLILNLILATHLKQAGKRGELLLHGLRNTRQLVVFCLYVHFTEFN